MNAVLRRPQAGEYASFYETYVRLVPESDIIETMARQRDETVALFSHVSPETSLVAHAPYTWTLRQVAGHLADGERVFGYRAMRISRGDTTPLAGFDENAYTTAGDFNRIDLTRLTAEFVALRDSNILMFMNLPDKAWCLRGVASGAEVSVQALAYILVGHVAHHLAIARRRLGQTP
jgi:hypothetical protein